MYPSSVRTWPFLGTIAAGWPSPAEEELLDTISFDDWLIQDSAFMLKVTHNAMQDAGIHENDIIIVQRDKQPRAGDIVIAEIDNKWVLRYYQRENGQIALYPANGMYEILTPEESLTVIGTVTACIRKYY
jgi:repressor LexA